MNRKKIKDSSELFEEFSGHDARHVDVVDVPDYDTYMVIGELVGVAYEAKRDNVTEKYFHEFRKTSRPLLIASHDGKEIRIIGGRYVFNDHGIVDRCSFIVDR